MEASSNMMSPNVDLYVLEYLVNMRWLLRYAVHELDPTVEQHYPNFIEQVTQLEAVLSRTTVGRSCTLADLPFGIVRLAREGVLYLLVSDHLLGGCPPTMHAFLQRAAEAVSIGAARASPQRAPANTDLNVSFPSDNDDGDGMEKGTSRTATELDAQPLAAIDPAGEDMLALAEVKVQGKETQAMLLLLRWLFSEGVLSEDELSATVEMGHMSDRGLSCHTNRVAPAVMEYGRFCRHQQLAHRLAEVVPFFFGAHLLVSRSLLLQYCATLLTTDAVMHHVTHLRSVASSASSCRSALPPPSSVEGALLEWFQAIVDSINGGEDGAVVLARLEDCSPLRAFIQHGPFCEDVMDPADRDFFRLVQSGESVCVVLLFYCPDAVPLAALSTALHATEGCIQGSLDTGPRLELVHRHLSVHYWTAIVTAARQLGVGMLLTPEEIVTYGRTALPLHLFCFIQQLFAVLATNAEEDVRVSADTAWWEQMKSKDGLTVMMRASGTDSSRNPHDGSDSAATRCKTSTSGAQQVLRRSMQDSFSPFAFATRDACDDAGGISHDRVALGHDEWVQEKRGVAPLSSTARVAASLDTGEFHSIQTGVGVPASGRGNTDEDTTQFSIECARTQREDEIVSRRACEETLETTTSVLRPMVKSRGRTQTHPSAAASRSATTTASLDMLTKVSDLSRHRGQERTDSRASVFGAHVIDTYTRAAEEDAPHGDAAVADVLALPAGRELSDALPTSADTLLHTRAVDAGLNKNAAGTYTELATAPTLWIDKPGVKAPQTPKPLSSKQDETELSAQSAGDGYSDNSNTPVVIQVRGVSGGMSSTSVRAVELSMASSLTGSTDFAPQAPPPTVKEARVAAKEIDGSDDLSGLIQTAISSTDSHCASGMSPTPRLRTAAIGAAEPCAMLDDGRTCPLLGSFITASTVTSAMRRVVTHKHDAEDWDEGSDSDKAISRRTSDGTSARPSPLKGSSPTIRGKTAVAAKLPRIGATLAACSRIPRRESAATQPKRTTSLISCENDSSSPHSCTRPSAMDIAAQDEDKTLLREEAETLTRATRTGKRCSPPAEKAEQVGWQPKGLQKGIAVGGDHARVTCDLPISPVHEQTPTREDGDALPRRISSPSLVFPGSGAHRDHRHVGENLVESCTSNRTLSEGTNSFEETPLTRVQTCSASEVYGSEYTSLLEDMAASDVDLFRRRHRGAVEESWYSSVSWSYHRTLRSAADSVASAMPLTQNTAQVRELLDRLTGISLEDMVDKDKQELYSVLAQQQAVVNELKAALHSTRTRVGKRGLFCTASHRPTLQRRRMVQLQLPLEETHDRRVKTHAQTGREILLKARETSGDGAVVGASVMSAATVESGISVANTSQSDFAGQLAETDVSSQMSECHFYPTSVRPPVSS
ncbi:hypothetical protein Q4I28_008286 [Leishmania naiffi]|uniref:Calponin-homology (CH) domain-containing protein n=1 Tax=Leishmania naiffi TaxID=5678 RepID=A0AAW3B5A3_9TRYP